MADVLAMSPSSYGRLERGESSASFEELIRISKSLGVQIHDLLPEIFSVHQNPTNSSQSGLIFGNIYNNYYDRNEYAIELEAKIKLLEAQVQLLQAENIKLKTA